MWDHGVLMLQRPGEAHAVWHFWDGPDRDFTCWHLNLQAPFRRTPIGYDTQDLELDLVVSPDGSFVLKDVSPESTWPTVSPVSCASPTTPTSSPPCSSRRPRRLPAHRTRW